MQESFLPRTLPGDVGEVDHARCGLPISCHLESHLLWVLTCFYCENLNLYISVKQEGQIGEIDSVTIHPQYKHGRAYNDLAVIKIRPSKGN